MNNITPLESAYQKGRTAKRPGLGEHCCPDRDIRKKDGRLTFSRAFRKAWLRGYKDESRSSVEVKDEYQGG